jgi:hypothetical protein
VLVPDVLERTYGARMEVLEHAGMRVVVDTPPPVITLERMLDTSSEGAFLR